MIRRPPSSPLFPYPPLFRSPRGRRAVLFRHGRPAAGDVGAFRGVARHWSHRLPVLRLPPQPAAPGGPVGAVKLHSKIVLGLVLGAASGVAANQLAPGAPWVRWVGDNVAGPVGQGFLRLLLMTVIPLG